MTTFYFVRHGEPDYQSVGDWSGIPFGQAFAGLTQAGEKQILSRARDIPIAVERDLHEWDSDRTHTVRDEQELLRLCQEHDACGGIHPAGSEKLWESRQQVRDRAWKVLERYSGYERVAVTGHAMMMQDVTGVPFDSLWRDHYTDPKIKITVVISQILDYQWLIERHTF